MATGHSGAVSTSCASNPNPPLLTPPTFIGGAWYVPAGGDFQAALDAALPGDLIKLEAGATFQGSFVLPNKPGDRYITIRSSAPDSALPPADTRISPAYAGALPKIVSPGCNIPALQTSPGTHHFQFIGAEFIQANDGALLDTLVLLGGGDHTQTDLSQVPHHLVLDRVYIHGLPNSTLKHCLALNSASTTLSNSYIADCKIVGFDSQAVLGFNGPGPFTIVNNYLEAAGENIMFGGADPRIPNLVPSDIKILRNSFNKPLSWKTDDPSYAGTHWTVKNLLELKNAQRVLIDGNTFEHNWPDEQQGFAVQFTPRNQDGGAPWSIVRDVTFTNNVVRHTANGVNMLGQDDIHTSQRAENIFLQNNLFEDVGGAQWGGNGTLLQVLRGPLNLVVKNNTAFHAGSFIVADGAPATQGFTFINNVVGVNRYGITGTGTGVGTATLNAYFPGYVFEKNIIVGPWPTLGSATISMFPADNFFPMDLTAVGFVDLAGGNYRLALTSPYANAGTDGNAVGVDWTAFDAAQTVSQALADTPPAPPGNLTAASGVPTLFWTPNGESDLAGYKVYYGTAPRTYSAVVDAGNVTTFTAANLTAGVTYYFAVTAYDAAGSESGFSNEVTVALAVPVPPIDLPPAPPANLHTLPGGILAWDANTESDLAGYRMYYGTAPSTYVPEGVDIGNVTTIPVTVLNPQSGVTYYLAITASDTVGNESGYSNEVTVTLP